jgi:diguanylate cyclase (GGDEF)-like protein
MRAMLHALSGVGPGTRAGLDQSFRSGTLRATIPTVGRNKKDDDRPPLGESGLPRLDNFDYESTSTRQTETSHVAPESSRVSSRAVVTVVEGADAGRVVAFGRHTTILVGRATSCQLTLPDIGVSRQHAKISVTKDGFVVEDLGSKNGTFVDGDRIQKKTVELGTSIKIGPHVMLRVVSMSHAEEALARQLYDSSMRDALTKAYNRRYLIDRLAAEISFSERHKSALSVIMFDLDHFKRINDSYGHAAGDQVLAACASIVTATLRSEDVLARTGGEEFAAVLRGIDHEHALACAERLRAAIATRPIEIDETRTDVRSAPAPLTVPVTISLGVASIDDCEEATIENLFAIADERLYAAKRAGRNCVRGR